MILFVFEGQKREPKLFKAIEESFHFGKERIICSYGSDIQSLYNKAKVLDAPELEGRALDIVALLKEARASNPEDEIHQIASSDDVSEIYLFFDLDPHNKRYPNLSEQLGRIEELLRLFGDETANGKLYISYPMIEAIYYTKELPDECFKDYTIGLAECKDFKNKVNEFTHYKSFELTLSDRIPTERDCWVELIKQHESKARQLTKVYDGELSPEAIFTAERDEHILPSDKIAILASLPLFLRDYFGAKIYSS